MRDTLLHPISVCEIADEKLLVLLRRSCAVAGVVRILRASENNLGNLLMAKESIRWKRMRSGDRPGLQNRRAAGFLSPVGSTPTRFRHLSIQLASLRSLARSVSANTATLPLACSISLVTMSPYTFIVVRMFA